MAPIHLSDEQCRKSIGSRVETESVRLITRYRDATEHFPETGSTVHHLVFGVELMRLGRHSDLGGPALYSLPGFGSPLRGDWLA
jgi:hypothetical protein